MKRRHSTTTNPGGEEGKGNTFVLVAAPAYAGAFVLGGAAVLANCRQNDGKVEPPETGK